MTRTKENVAGFQKAKANPRAAYDGHISKIYTILQIGYTVPSHWYTTNGQKF